MYRSGRGEMWLLFHFRRERKKDCESKFVRGVEGTWAKSKSQPLPPIVTVLLALGYYVSWEENGARIWIPS